MAVPISEAEKIVSDGEKSIGIRLLDKKDNFGKLLYNIIEIPSIKKKVYMDSDYSILAREGE